VKESDVERRERMRSREFVSKDEVDPEMEMGRNLLTFEGLTMEVDEMLGGLGPRRKREIGQEGGIERSKERGFEIKFRDTFFQTLFIHLRERGGIFSGSKGGADFLFEEGKRKTTCTIMKESHFVQNVCEMVFD